MEMKHWLSAAVGCLAFALWTMPVAAAPISGAWTNPKVAADSTSIVETTHWQRRYAYYYGGYYPDSFERYYPYADYDYYYRYPSYHNYYVYPRYSYYRHHHHHHHHHFRDYRRW